MATYDPQKLTVVYKGAVLSGFADGTFVEITRNADAFSLTVGADGEGARARSADKSGQVKITLLQTSLSNDVLSAFSAVDEATGAGGGPLQVRDAVGTTVAHAPYAWIKKLADSSFSKEIEGREWVFESYNLVYNVGGSVLP